MGRKETLTKLSVPVKASFVIMGTGQLMYKQWIKGLLYLAVFVGTCFYLLTAGIQDMAGFDIRISGCVLQQMEGEQYFGLNSAKEAEKEQKRQEIRAFYDREATPLGELADTLFDSPAFWNPKWELKSTKAKVWQDEIRAKIAQAAADLNSLQTAGGDHTSALVAKYLECQDMEQVLQFRHSMELAVEATVVETADEQDNVMGHQTLKIHGTRRQMQMLRDQLELMGMEFEILKDGIQLLLSEGIPLAVYQEEIVQNKSSFLGDLRILFEEYEQKYAEKKKQRFVDNYIKQMRLILFCHVMNRA
mgnify:CR=1 FL=1